MMPTDAKPLFSYRKHWAQRFGTAPFLPMSRAEMEVLGWDECDIVLVTGDAYVDHPSFGMAIVGRLLEAQGFRVGIIAQPDWSGPEAFTALGRPSLFFGVTAGNMDSMVNRYTADRKLRRNDSYTPNDEGGRRPDRAVIVYAQRCREAYRDSAIVIGGIEASLRRVAHYDYWSDTVRRSILVDSKADLLVYGNAERAIVDIAHRAAKGELPRLMTSIRGTAVMRAGQQDDTTTADLIALESAEPAGSSALALRLPSFQQVLDDPALYAHASRHLHLESNPNNARALIQRHGNRDVWVNPPPLPLTSAELDGVYDLPFARAPHPSYGGAPIPAWEMIKNSVTILRGCFGGCSFCSITEHEGRIIQSRSEASILREIERIRDGGASFTGIISDLGGATANMWRLGCDQPSAQAVCRRWSCVFPTVCKRLATDHEPLIRLYRMARAVPGVRKVLIGSGVRYDLAVNSPAYIRELAAHHVGGYLKIAPEHTEPGPLALMMKPGIASYDRFKELFDAYSREAGKEQYLIPYFIAGHPGTTDLDMLNLALWLKRQHLRLDQVQTFLPTPLALATTMYHTGHNPLRPISRND
ncbi:MAG: YgiQ family radical SAM protein, partial [Rhodospirillaceae bacterium]